MIDDPWLWWCGQLGIMLEIIGAALIVISAFQARSRIKDVSDTWDGDLTVKIRDLIASQAYSQLIGFCLLALGLLGQFASGLSNIPR